MNINDLAKEISEWRNEKGFYTPSSISNALHSESASDGDWMLAKLMLVVSEVSEAAEAVRSGDQENFNEELADTFIRLLDICGTVGIDIESEIEKKMDINKTRPKKHGRKTSA